MPVLHYVYGENEHTTMRCVSKMTFAVATCRSVHFCAVTFLNLFYDYSCHNW